MKHYFTALATPAIDPENGIIRTVSLIELGDAKGHFDKKGRQVIVDEVTLEQIFKQCTKLGSIKVKADHGSGVFEIVGWADNFALTSNKVTADVHLYESEPNRPRLLEIAEKNPTHMGISMEFTGEDKARGTVCMSRCDAVIAAALVDDPAANSSLFSVPAEEAEQEPETKNTNMDEEQTEPTLKDLMSKLEEFNTRLTALETPTEDTESEPEKGEEQEPVATEKETEPTGSDPEKTYENPDADIDSEETKKIEMAAERAAERVFKKFASQIGITKLGKPGNAGASTKEKHFEEYVADVAVAKFGNDQNAARAHVLTNLSANPEWKKAYMATRPVKTA